MPISIRVAPRIAIACPPERRVRAGRRRVGSPGQQPERHAGHRREQDRRPAVEEVLAAIEDDVRREHAEQGEAPCQVGSEDATGLEAPPVQLRAPATRRR